MIAAETEFDENEIASQGADNIGSLLLRFQPFIDPNGDEPVLLINGKPAGFDRSILSFPAGALARLAVLKPEAARAYGEKADRRVVNLILKRRFDDTNLEAGTNFATAGGQVGDNLAAVRSSIRGETRWIARARADHQGALFRSARQESPKSATGNFVEYGGGVANDRSVHPAAFDTLLPSTRTISAGFAVARPLGSVSASFNFDVNRIESAGLGGLVISAAGQSTSLFSNNSRRAQSADHFSKRVETLRRNSMTQSVNASLTLTGTINGWQSSFSASYARYDGHSLFEAAAETEFFSQTSERKNVESDQNDTPSDRGIWATSSKSRTDTFSMRANLQKSIFDLPTGAIALSVAASTNLSRTSAFQSEDGRSTSSNSPYRNTGGQMTLSLPLSRRKTAFSALGDLTLDFAVGRQSMTGSSAQTSFGGGATWGPFKWVQIRGSLDRTENAPSFDQLNAQVITSINRVFDYAQKEVVETAWTTGGNPHLLRGRQENVSLAATIRPLGQQAMTLNLNYRQSVATGGAAPFPEFTPAIEAAFPERVIRDASGRLRAVDARPINIERATSSSLVSSLALRLGGGRRPGSTTTRGGAAIAPTQIGFSLTHRLELRSVILIRHGLPVIDRLKNQGAPRHKLNMELSVGKPAFGATISGSWRSAADVIGFDGKFRESAPVILGASAFVNVDQLVPWLRGSRVANGLVVSASIQNVLDGYRQVTLPNGQIPAGYTRSEIDPLGRTMQLIVRKKF